MHKFPASSLQNFVEALLFGANRQIMLEHDYLQKGPYQAGRPATHIGEPFYLTRPDNPLFLGT